MKKIMQRKLLLNFQKSGKQKGIIDMFINVHILIKNNVLDKYNISVRHNVC